MPPCCAVFNADNIPNFVSTGTESDLRPKCSSPRRLFILQHTRKLKPTQTDSDLSLFTNYGIKNPGVFHLSSHARYPISAGSASENMEKRTCMQCRRPYSIAANNSTSCRYARVDICDAPDIALLEQRQLITDRQK